MPNIKDTFAEGFHRQMSVLQQSMCIFKAGLSSLSDGWAKDREKVRDVPDSNQNVERTCNPDPRLQNLKIYLSKGCRKTCQKWIMYVANTAILNLRVFSERYLFFRSWVFALTGEYF